MSHPRPTPKEPPPTRTVSARCAADLAEQADRVAAAIGCPRSAVVVEALELFCEYLEQQEKELGMNKNAQ